MQRPTTNTLALARLSDRVRSEARRLRGLIGSEIAASRRDRTAGGEDDDDRRRDPPARG